MSIENEIKELKNRIKLVKSNYHLELFKILNKIFELRKSKNPDFNIVMLHKEVVNELTFDQVNYIMGLRFCNNKTWDLINTKKISATIICRGFYKTKQLKDDKLQNEFVKQIICNNINYSDIMRYDADQLIEKIEHTKIPMSKKARLNCQTIGYLREARRLLHSSINQFTDDEMTKIMTEIELLHKEFCLNQKIKRGQYLVIKEKVWNLINLINKKQHMSSDKFLFNALKDYCKKLGYQI